MSESSSSPSVNDGFADGVREIAANRENLTSLLNEIYRGQVQGEITQDDLETFFSGHPGLANVAWTIAESENEFESPAEELVASAVSREALDEQTGEEFLRFWQKHSWIAEPARSYRYSLVGFDHWTDQSMDLDYQPANDYQFTLDWNAQNGIDQLWKMRLPFQLLISHLVNTTETARILTKNTLGDLEGANLDPEEVNILQKLADQLVSESHELQATLKMLEAFSQKSPDEFDYTGFSMYLEDQDLDESFEESGSNEDIEYR